MTLFPSYVEILEDFLKHQSFERCFQGKEKHAIIWDRSSTDPLNTRENSLFYRLAQNFFHAKTTLRLKFLSLKMADLERSVLLGFCEFLHFFFRKGEFSSRSRKPRREKAMGNVFLTKTIW